jgi:diguanylate cyclase (GGDEF)-like protein/PAS domain S-box-containing protein
VSGHAESSIVITSPSKWTSRSLEFSILYVLLATIGIAIYLVLPESKQANAYEVFGIVAVASVIAGMLFHKPAWRTPWVLLAVDLSLLVTGDYISNHYESLFGRELPFPSIADGLFFLGNVCLFVAVVLILRAREPYRDTGSLIDAAIIGTAAAALSWIFLMVPYATDPSLSFLQKIVSLSTPVFDLVTLVLIVRLVFGTGLRIPSFYFLLVAMLSTMIADVVYSEMILHSSYSRGDLVDVGWLYWYVFVGLAALHPSMTQITEAGTTGAIRLTNKRLVLLTTAVLIVPAVALFQTIRDRDVNVPIIAGASAILFLLVVMRMTGLVRMLEVTHDDLQRALNREQAMRQASISLVSASSQEDVYQSAAEAMGRLVRTGADGRVLRFVDGWFSIVAEANHHSLHWQTTRFQDPQLARSVAAGLVDGRVQRVSHDESRELWRALNLTPEQNSFVLTPIVSSGNVTVIGIAVAEEMSQEALLLIDGLRSQVSLALDRVALSEQLHRRESEERFHSLVQNASDVILIIGADGRISYASPSAQRVLGIESTELVGSDGLEHVHPEDLEKAHLFYANIIASPGAIRSTDYRIREMDGAWRYVEIVGNNLLADSSVHGVVVNLRDITERKEAEEQLTFQAYHDALTNLPNRALFMDRLSDAMARSTLLESRTAVLFIDLDRFKVINDSLGHETGDLLLSEAGQRILSAVRSEDIVSRLGGDEFTVLIEDVASPEMAIGVAERLIDAFNVPLSIGDREVFVETSIGIAVQGEHASQAGDVLRQADIAMYQAKERGGHQYAIFDAAMGSSLLSRLELETDLRWAIERDELELFYQPEVELSTSRIVSMEALVRWRHPKHGLISPSEFIPVAEDSGIILHLGRWVLERACQQGSEWHTRYPQLDLEMSVNLSVRQYQHPGIVEEVASILADSGLPATRLRLEITETVIMDEGESSQITLNEFRNLGVQLAIDDFGSGYSSLGYLRRYPVDVLKIDREFIDGLGEDPQDAAIISTISSLAHTLGMVVTAEGIETSEQVEQVKKLACDRAQGYFFSQPLNAERADSLLRLTATAHSAPAH